MPTAQVLLDQKGTDVYTAPASISVLEATQRMNEHKVGALVVTAEEQVAGIFTERDVLVHVVAAGRDPARTCVEELMSRSPVCCSPTADIETIQTLMKNKRVRHIPVLGDDGSLRGLVSMGDINAYRAHDGEVTIQYLHDYIHGRA